MPKNLDEQLALKGALSDPFGEKAKSIKKDLEDPRWPAGKGWEKAAYNINDIEIHFVRNKYTNEVDDFKFK